MGWTIPQSRKPTKLRLSSLEDGKSCCRTFLSPSFILLSVVAKPRLVSIDPETLLFSCFGLLSLRRKLASSTRSFANTVPATAPRFLLKYASRDELELLGQGTGGIVEIRNAIAEYEDKSPLYGYMRYRRRNVILKYLPEGCSRLVQGSCFSFICPWDNHVIMLPEGKKDLPSLLIVF